MEELHHIHKDVPFGYWVLWVQPAWRALARKRPERPVDPKLASFYERLIALR